MLNESVIKLLKNGMWDLATCANGESNVVPVAVTSIFTSDIDFYFTAFYALCSNACSSVNEKKSSLQL